MKLNLSVTKKQKLFIDATESEVLFGGAAGGGKRGIHGGILASRAPMLHADARYDTASPGFSHRVYPKRGGIGEACNSFACRIYRRRVFGISFG